MIKQLQYANHRVGAPTKESSLVRYVDTVLCIKKQIHVNYTRVLNQLYEAYL